MAWIFAAVVLIVVVYLAIHYPPFRKAMWVCLAIISTGTVGVVAVLYFQQIENERQEEQARRLIRHDEIVIANPTLGQPYGSWKVTGNVTNKSVHELSGFTLKIKVQDCPQPGRCITIGEDNASTSVSVPPNQMRSFDLFVSLRNMPQPQKMEWTYSLEEVRGKRK